MKRERERERERITSCVWKTYEWNEKENCKFIIRGGE